MVGKNLSHYKITAELGRGGMGIVYKATDTKLERTVAIKVLPSAALASEEDRARFYREAKAAAQLHHPHIASIFEIDEAIPRIARKIAGEDANVSSEIIDEAMPEDPPPGMQPSPFIAMEFVDGQTLDAKIKEGPLKLNDAIRIGKEIASALEAAHEEDIVHRDIKSANVMLTRKNSAKVLDFGLAKTAQSTKLTRMGSTLGTVAYMSPEQARGEDVDLRTDIWSLGVVLHEMIAGRHPFPGDYEQAAIYSILNEDPEPLTSVRTGVPMSLEWVVDKCLAKKADERYQSTTELIVDLGKVDTERSSGARSVSGRSIRDMPTVMGDGLARDATLDDTVDDTVDTASFTRPVARRVAAGVVILALVALAWFIGSLSAPESEPPFRKIPMHLGGITRVRLPTMSPSGEYFVFEGADTLGNSGLFVHDFSTAKTHYMQGTFGQDLPAFSPDGRRIATAWVPSAGVWVTVMPEGLPVLWSEVGDAPKWENNESLIVGFNSDLYRLRGSGKTLELISRADSIAGAKKFIFTGDMLRSEEFLLSSHQFYSRENADLITVDLKTGEKKLLESASINAWYVRGGFVMYQRGTDYGPISVRRFNPESRSWDGPPFSLFSDMNWVGAFPTPDGDLLYIPPTPDNRNTQIISINENGKRSVVRMLAGDGWFNPMLSPNGEAILISRSETKDIGYNVELVALNLETDSESLISTSAGRERASWSKDGTEVFFTEGFFESIHIARQRVGSLNVSEIFADNASDPYVSPNGELLVYLKHNVRRTEKIEAVNLKTGDTTVVVNTPETKAHPKLSPNNNWVAYNVINQRGVELHVSSIDGSDAITLAENISPDFAWSSDGSYLYYLRRGDVYRLRVDTGDQFQSAGSEEKVTYDGLGSQIFQDPCSPKMYLLAYDRHPQPYTVVEWWQNWSAELDRTLPRN